MGDAGLRFCLKSSGSTMPSRFQGRLSPLAREALAEVMATFILVVSTHSSSKTHGQIMGARKSLNGRKNKGQKKSKERREEPLGTMSYQTSSKRSPPFCLLIGARKLLFFCPIRRQNSGDRLELV